ncbi:hypothetical protein F2P79_009425 [Pimephales promelas]|nr:hypothetical protein F2P79_009425 [Pimephales promelas]
MKYDAFRVPCETAFILRSYNQPNLYVDHQEFSRWTIQAWWNQNLTLNLQHLFWIVDKMFETTALSLGVQDVTNSVDELRLIPLEEEVRQLHQTLWEKRQESHCELLG